MLMCEIDDHKTFVILGFLVQFSLNFSSNSISNSISLISKSLSLLDELFQIHKLKPTIGWKQSFQEYLQTVPSYYYDVSTMFG